MARTHRPKPVPGLSFRVQITPLLRGKPVDGVAPTEFDWDQSFAIDWHEGHRDMALGFAFEAMRKTVREHLQPKARRRS